MSIPTCIRNIHKSQTRQSFYPPIQFFTINHIPQTIEFILNHYVLSKKITQFQIATTNIQQNLNKLLTFIADKNMSFIIKSIKYNEDIMDRNEQKSHQNKYFQWQEIQAVCLNLDLKDLLALFQTELNMTVFQTLGLITQQLRSSLYKYSNCQKGQYLFNFETIFRNKKQNTSIKVKDICKGLVFSKIIGWRNILYATKDTQNQNPFILLKLGGTIQNLIKNKSNQLEELTNDPSSQLLNENQLHISSLNLALKPNSVKITYLISLSLDKLNIIHPKLLEKKQQQIQNFHVLSNTFSKL